MSPELVWKNLVQYCLQIGLLVGLAAFVPTVLRLRMPRARLAYLQILLLACLLLPLMQTWRHEVISVSVETSSIITAIRPHAGSAAPGIPAGTIGLALLAAGAIARLAWLGTGFWKLWLYRRRSQPLAAAMPWKTAAEVRLSHDVTSPVTFGLRPAVVLVPAQFPRMSERARTAILCHELLHVERRDWLFILAEEMIRSIFWFHPAIWWLLGEIQLAREQAVDRAVIEITGEREEYLDTLLAVAGANPQCDLAPAPLFLRRRHLKQRVVSLLKDARMSRARLASAMAACLAMLSLAGWFASTAFPLSAAPRVMAMAAPSTIAPPPAPVVTPPAPSERTRPTTPRTVRPQPVETAPAVPEPQPLRIRVGGNVQQARLIYQPKPYYPAAAKEVRIQGVVKLSAVIDKDGAIQQLEVISGHPLLVQSALAAVKDWVYEKTLLNGEPVEVATQIDVNYTLSQ